MQTPSCNIWEILTAHAKFTCYRAYRPTFNASIMKGLCAPGPLRNLQGPVVNSSISCTTNHGSWKLLLARLK